MPKDYIHFYAVPYKDNSLSVFFMTNRLGGKNETYFYVLNDYAQNYFESNVDLPSWFNPFFSRTIRQEELSIIISESIALMLPGPSIFVNDDFAAAFIFGFLKRRKKSKNFPRRLKGLRLIMHFLQRNIMISSG